MRELSDNFEDVHLVLARKLGDKYKETYPNYTETMDKVDTWLTESRAETRKRKREAVKSSLNKLRIEEEFFRSRISRDLEGLESEQAEFVEDFERHTFTAKELIRPIQEFFSG